MWRGSTESSSSLLSPQLCKCEKPPLTELSTASSISVPTQWVEFHPIITNNNPKKKKKKKQKKPRWKLRNQNLKLHLFERSCIAHFVRVGFGGRRERNWNEIRGFLGEKKHSFFFFGLERESVSVCVCVCVVNVFLCWEWLVVFIGVLLWIPEWVNAPMREWHVT